MYLPTSSAGQDLLLRHKRVIFDVNFNGASPSTSVSQGSTVPGGVYLQSQGVDQVTADDSGANFVGISNNNAGASTVGVLVDCAKTLGGVCDTLYSVAAVEAITSTAGSVSTTLAGAATTGITASGNIAFTITGSTANLNSDQVTYRVTLECKIDQSQTHTD